MIDKFSEFIERRFDRYVDKIDRAIYNGICENPVYLGFDPLQPNRPVYVPCGHCVSCLSRTKKDWIVRNNFELQQYSLQDCCFMTLTLSDENIETSYDDFQKFLKWYRRFITRMNKDKKFKYFGCFERGEKSGRPHFHLLVYGDNPQTWSMFKNKKRDYKYINEWFAKHIWKRGLVRIDTMTGESISYVVGYVLKKNISCVDTARLLRKSRRLVNYLNKHSKSDLQAGFKRFAYYFSSKSLGFKYLLKSLSSIVKKCYVNIQGYKYSVPRYFAKKIKEMFDLDIFARFRKSHFKLDKFLTWLNVDNIQDVNPDGDFIFNAIAEYNNRVIDNNKIKNYNKLQLLKLRC